MVVFDMAGTTVDEQNLVYRTLQKAVHAAGFPMPLEQVLLLAAGKEKRQAIIDLLGLGPADGTLIEKTYGEFLLLLDEAYRDAMVVAQPGALATFKALRQQNVYVVLNTGYNQGTAELLLAKLGWQAGIEYDLLVTASQVQRSRPHPDMIALAQAKLKVADARAVAKVGDSIIDIEEGRNAGCGLVLGITTGAHTRDQLESAHPDAVVDALGELLSLV